MPDYQRQIRRASEQLARVTEDLEMWEGFGATTVTEEATGKVTDLRAQMIERCKSNIDLYKRIIAALSRKST